jgi:hypothetical protein
VILRNCPHADAMRIVEDMTHMAIAALEPEHRKAAIMEARASGAMSDADAAYWIYVFGLRDA